MKESVYVFGHQNPDTDSICSSIAYANLKNKLGTYKATPYRLGKLNKETKFVLDYFGVKEPKLLNDVKVKLKDLDLYETTCLSKKDPVKSAWDILNSSNGSRLIPIVDEDNTLEGVISIGDITMLFMELSDEDIITNHEILFENLVRILDGRIVSGSYNYEKVEGSIYIGTTIPDESKLSSKDIVLTGKIETAFHFVNETKCGCVILTNDRPTYNIQSPNCAIVAAPHSMFKTVSMVTQAVSIGSIMGKDRVTEFSADSYLDDVVDIMKTSKHRNFPVVNRAGNIAGIISRRHLMGHPKKKVILIDHNERSQSVEGLEQAKIIEIIDHHRVADIQTDEPLSIRSEPLGCSATIVYKMYQESNIEIEKNIAGLLLSAILSDTLMFSSPTCTIFDKETAEKLAEIADVNISDYGRAMFTASTSLEDYTPREILSIDRKKFSFDKYCAYISQVNTLDFKSVLNLNQEILDAMEDFLKDKGCDLVILLITDIVLGGSEIYVVGNPKAKTLVYTAFGIGHDEYRVFLPGVVSRKKQIVPKLTAVSHIGV